MRWSAQQLSDHDTVLQGLRVQEVLVQRGLLGRDQRGVTVFAITAIQGMQLIARQQHRHPFPGLEKHPVQGEIHVRGDRFGHHELVAFVVPEDHPVMLVGRLISTAAHVLQGQRLSAHNRAEGRALDNHALDIQQALGRPGGK